MSCSICVQRPGAHSFSPMGYDHIHGIRVFYTCPAEATEYWDGKGIVAHMRALLLEEEDCWIWKLNASGFGVQHAMEVGVAMDLISFFCESATNAPFKIQIINGNGYLRAMLAMLSAFIPPSLIIQFDE